MIFMIASVEARPEVLMNHLGKQNFTMDDFGLWCYKKQKNFGILITLRQILEYILMFCSKFQAIT